jgi:uncharacterized protein YifN (PemK superfamily)
MKLKFNVEMQNSLKGKLASILSELKYVESRDADKIISWYLVKSKYFKKIFNNEHGNKYPDDMKRGDIVLLDSGINISPEFSDYDTKKHFVMIWCQQGQNFIVIPLTKTPQNKNKLGVNLGIINGLPENTDTYAKIDAIKSISIRRINRIKEYQLGKITITDAKILNKINAKILNYFVDIKMLTENV